MNTEIEKIKLKGNHYFNAGLHKDAIDTYSLALEKDPNSVSLLCNRCAAYLQLYENTPDE